VKPDDRQECGWPGISAEECISHVGCCFDDSILDVKWCFKGGYYQSAVCAVSPYDREECGWPGISQEECLSEPGCCFDDAIEDVKWCYKQIGPVY
jgi:hypothetical protein